MIINNNSASMMTLGQMGEHNELMAIKSSGVSLARVMLPIGIMAVFISIGAFFVGNNLVPRAYNEICTLRDAIGRIARFLEGCRREAGTA